MSAIYKHDVRTKIKYPLSRVMHGCYMAFIRDQKNDAILYKTRVFGLSLMIQPWAAHVLITVSCEYFYSQVCICATLKANAPRNLI